MTEILRSRSGRPSVSRGRGAVSGTITSCAGGLVEVMEASLTGNHQRYNRVTNPLGYSFGPGGSSTNPCVPASAVKSPDPFVGQGIAQLRPQSSVSTLTGRKEVSRVDTATAPPSAIRSAAEGVCPIAAYSAGTT